eukprot:1558029-Pleurochrysis_carterae.AAC.2
MHVNARTRAHTARPPRSWRDAVTVSSKVSSAASTRRTRCMRPHDAQDAKRPYARARSSSSILGGLIRRAHAPKLQSHSRKQQEATGCLKPSHLADSSPATSFSGCLLPPRTNRRSPHARVADALARRV